MTFARRSGGGPAGAGAAPGAAAVVNRLRKMRGNPGYSPRFRSISTPTDAARS